MGQLAGMRARKYLAENISRVYGCLIRVGSEGEASDRWSVVAIQAGRRQQCRETVKRRKPSTPR